MKAKVSFLVEVEYEINPDHYEEGMSYEEMLAVDLEGANNDPFILIDSSSAKWTITGKLVDV